jgi:hypothetical protein
MLHLVRDEADLACQGFDDLAPYVCSGFLTADKEPASASPYSIFHKDELEEKVVRHFIPFTKTQKVKFSGSG